MAIRRTWPLLLPVLAAAAAAQSRPDSLRRLIDLEALPRLTPGVTCRQFASTDPSGRGEDHGHFLRREGDRCILAEMSGPGVIARLWSANADGRLRIYFDGEKEPRIDCPFQDLFTGRYPPFVEPIAIHKSGGWISYFPIPYARSCRVEVSGLANPSALYYHVQYVTYPTGTEIRTFTRELPADERTALADVLRFFKEPGSSPGQRPGDTRLAGKVIIDAGVATELARIREPGTLVRLELAPEPRAPAFLRGLLVELWWDDAAEPSVCVPLGDFFGVGFGVTPYRGLVLGWPEDGGGYCNFPMPWRQGARICLRNTLTAPLAVMWSLVWRKGAPPADSGWFHAEFRSTDGVGDELYELANIEGAGKYVGVNQALQGVGDLWYLEGNERFFVDGETTPSIDGTGTEDFYNGGWYWGGGTFALPLHGLNVKEEWKSNRTTPYRMQVPDAVPFARSLVARIEHGSRNAVKDAYYSSVAYWYGEHRAVRRPSPAELTPPRQWVVLPKGWQAASALAWTGPVERATWEELTTDYRGLGRPLFQAFPVSYVERDAAALDPRVVKLGWADDDTVFTTSLLVPHADLYRLSLRLLGGLAHRPLEVRLGGTLLGLAEAHAPRAMPLPPKTFAPIGLAKGEHRLELRLGPVVPLPLEAVARDYLSIGEVGIDALHLAPASPFVRTWRIGPPLAARPDGTVADEMEVEARYLGADFDPATAGWKKVDADGDGLDLNRHVSSASPMLGYLAFAVKSPDARSARVLLGSDDGARVWVNGELRWSRAIHRHLSADEDSFDVALRAGWNRFLVKVKNDYGGYGVMLRVADPDRTLRIAADPVD